MQKIKTISLTLLALFLVIAGYSQVNFTRHDSIVVIHNSTDTLLNPWAGGFNSVQFSEIDIDIDGKKDIFVFDRAGNKISTYINEGTPGQTRYIHRPEFIKNFPKGLHDWAILRDYNCDGKMDIFTYSSGGMAVYRNTSNSVLSFELDTSLIYSDYNPDGSPNYINLYISSTDIPAIDDIDSDGDLDVLTFSIVGSYVEYHKNLSMERYGDCDSLDFQLSNKCWGFFKENLSGNSVTLYDTCSFNVNNPERINGGNKHAGSTLLTLDVNADNSKDLVLSDVSFNNFTLLVNQDASVDFTESSMISQDSLFPQNNNATISMDIDIFPTGFYFDVNNDNVKDLIAAPNCYNGCSNEHNVWYYVNSGANNNPDFGYMQNDFIQDGMIEVGEGAHPTFFDYNADGLTDIIVGNYGVYNPAVGPLLYESSLWVYENIGTPSNPVFELVDQNYHEISAMNLDLNGSRPTLGLAPTFGDIDGDGDDDMLLGDYNGLVHLFTNTAGAGNPAAFVLAIPEYLGIDVGQDATPLFYDVNKDNVIDLVIGNKKGSFVYYENKGNVSSPNFQWMTDSLGQRATRGTIDFQGSSNPVFVDSSGTTILYSGSKSGRIYKFGDIDGNLNGTFSVDSNYLQLWEGANSFVAVQDLTNDGMLDMVVGNYSGGLAFFKGDLDFGVGIVEQDLELVKVYPNPTTGIITIDLGLNKWESSDRIELINMLGQQLSSSQVSSSLLTIDMQNLSSGIYFVRVTLGTKQKMVKVLKK